MKNKNVPTCLVAGVKTHNLQTPHTICYVAGRSGGHLIPALTHARLHAEKYPQDHIIFIATDTALDLSIVDPAAHVHTKIYMRLSKVPHRLFLLPLFFIRCALVFFKSLYVLRHTRVSSLISMGGYISVPVCFAARCLGIPITLFELNATPGRATLFLAPIAKDIFLCFEKTKTYFSQCITYVPYPLQYQHVPVGKELKEHTHIYGLVPHKRTVLVLGGSQGSLFLNRIIGCWLDASPHLWHTVQIIHQVGHTDTHNWNAWYQSHGIKAIVFEYTNHLSYWYACADLIICRAGAGTLFETLFFKKKCLIIPLITKETAHQGDNAQAMSQRFPEFFCFIEQSAIEKNPEILFSKLQTLLTEVGLPISYHSK